MATSVSFHTDCEQSLLELTGANGNFELKVASHMVAPDATKDCGWRGFKMQTLRLVSRYYLGEALGEVVHEVWPEPLKVVDGTGAHTWKLTKKQLRAAGCVAFDVDIASPIDGQGLLRFLNLPGDCGSDCQWSRKNTQVMYIPCVWVIPCLWPCVSHQQSLACCRILVRLDKYCKKRGFRFTYFSALTKIINMFRTYVDSRYGKPGVCFAGRWGAVAAAQKFVKRKVGKVKAQEKFKAGFRKTRSASKPCSFGALGPLDDDKIDAIASHNEKVGRWETESTRDVMDEGFWGCLDMSEAATDPWHHLLCFLQKPKGKLIEEFGDRATHLSALVIHKGAKIQDEFNMCFDEAEDQQDDHDHSFYEGFVGADIRITGPTIHPIHASFQDGRMDSSCHNEMVYAIFL